MFDSPLHNAWNIKWKNGGMEVSESYTQKKKYEAVVQNIRNADNFGFFPSGYI
jgi:hypothetical protein